jgi:hypothetical protein
MEIAATCSGRSVNGGYFVKRTGSAVPSAVSQKSARQLLDALGPVAVEDVAVADGLVGEAARAVLSCIRIVAVV